MLIFFNLNKTKLLPISLIIFKNDLTLLNNILNNKLPMNFFVFRTIDRSPDTNQTENKTFLRIPTITRSKFCEIFIHRVAEMSNTLERSKNLPGYDRFQEPVIFRKNLNLLLFDKLQTFKYSIYPESWFLS